VYGSYPSATDSWIVQGCGNAWSASTVYRSLPLSMTATSSPSSVTTPPPNSSSGETTPPPESKTGMTTGPEATSASGTAAASITDGATPEESESSQSLAWIAGVVIGCVVAIGAFAGFGFWLGRRRRRRREEGEGAGQGFTVHSAAVVRSGGTGSPDEDEASWATARAHAVAVADGIEVEGAMGEKYWARSPQELAGQGHVELEANPSQKGQHVYSY